MSDLVNAGLYWVIHYHHAEFLSRRVAVVGYIVAWRNPPQLRIRWDRRCAEVRRVFPTTSEGMIEMGVLGGMDKLERTVCEDWSVRHDVDRVEKVMESLDHPYWKLSFTKGRGCWLYGNETVDERIAKNWEHLWCDGGG